LFLKKRRPLLYTPTQVVLVSSRLFLHLVVGSLLVGLLVDDMVTDELPLADDLADLEDAVELDGLWGGKRSMKKIRGEGFKDEGGAMERERE
jgi:hypothetical protein